jgi:hypothetical protein
MKCSCGHLQHRSQSIQKFNLNTRWTWDLLSKQAVKSSVDVIGYSHCTIMGSYLEKVLSEFAKLEVNGACIFLSSGGYSNIISLTQWAFTLRSSLTPVRRLLEQPIEKSMGWKTSLWRVIFHLRLASWEPICSILGESQSFMVFLRN